MPSTHKCMRLQEVAATAYDTTTNERTKRITTQRNDCERCFTHVKCTPRPTTTTTTSRPFIECTSLALHVNRCDMWISHLPHVNWTVHRRMRHKLFFFFMGVFGVFVIESTARQLCALSLVSCELWDQNTVCRTIMRIDGDWRMLWVLCAVTHAVCMPRLVDSRLIRIHFAKSARMAHTSKRTFPEKIAIKFVALDGR